MRFSTSFPAAGPRSRTAHLPWVAALATFALALPLLWFFYSRHPLLYDTDSSYHLAVARLTAQHGVVRALPALRFSVLGSALGDKELLFHFLLAPFAAASDPLAGGRLALALLDALVLAAIAGLACRAIGAWGLLAPLWIGVGSLEVAWRLVRLRPELLSLLLLLCALAAAGAGRQRLVGVVAAVYALSYVAWHAFLGVFAALFVFRGWARRRWEWPLLLYPLLGTGIALRLHPDFPANLVVWKLVAIDFFRLKSTLDVGNEIRPVSTEVLLLSNAGFWALAAVLWWSRARHDGDRTPGIHSDIAADTADAFGVAAVGFGALCLLMSRFALYAFPFAGLWLLHEIGRRGETIGPRLRLPWRGSVPTLAALAVVAIAAAPGTASELARFARRTETGPQRARLADRDAFARALPAGAAVAAPWGDTATYLLWAPQGRYLNALDPMLMAVPYPQAYAAQRSLFAGDEPDAPLAALAVLDSDHVAWSLPGAPPRLLARLRGDPRATPLHVGFHALFALTPPPPGSFVLDWRVVPGGPVPVPAAAPVRGWPSYPRLADPRAQAMEGFVDAARVTGGRCIAFVRDQGPGDTGTYELAALGPTQLWRDGEALVSTGGNAAVLGDGVRFALPPTRRVTVLTCPGGDGRAGFYLLRRG